MTIPLVITTLGASVFEGKIPIITSDHAPHLHQEKKDLVAGAPGVQETYPFLIDLYLHSLISREILENVIYNNPKKILNSVGLDVVEAEIIVDPTVEYIFEDKKWMN